VVFWWLGTTDVSRLPWFLPAWLWPIVRDANVLLALPNLFRQSSLMLMSNSSHYFGDIPPNDVFYQNQILDHPIVWPFQLLCFNFGATHILHHYVVPQPFYLRQLVYSRVADRMVALGVRRNDFGALWRGNYYCKPTSADEQARGEVYGKLWFLLFATVGWASIVLWDMLISIKTSQKFVRFGAVVLGLRKSRGSRSSSSSSSGKKKKVDDTTDDSSSSNGNDNNNSNGDESCGLAPAYNADSAPAAGADGEDH